MKRLLFLAMIIPSFCIANSSSFVKNHGQIKDTDGKFRNDILFKYEQAGLSVFFFAEKVSYVLDEIDEKDSSMHMHRVDWIWKNCNDIIPNFDGSESKLPHKFYLDTIRITGVESDQKIIYNNIYDGVSLVFYLKDHSLKYDYIVNTASALNQIKSTYIGAEFNLSKDGQLEIQTSLGTISDSRPVSFDKNGQQIESDFKLEGNELKYSIKENVVYPITIDPEVQWSTYFGGFNNESASSVEHDDSNNVYIAGTTASTDFPITTGAYSIKNAGSNDCFISKLNSEGKLIWSTYFGGANNDQILDLDVDNNGIVHCASATGFGTSFPVTSNARNKKNPANGAYSRFDRNGKLLYSTFTSVTEPKLATDTIDRVYLIGRTDGFIPIKGNSYQNTRRGTVDFGLMCFNANNDSLIWSTYFGGSGNENGGNKIDVNPKGDKISFIGYTQSIDYPLKRAYADSATSIFTLYLINTCFDSTGNLMWSTYLCPPGGTNSFVGNGLSFINDTKVAIGSSNLQNNFPAKKNNWIRKADLLGAFIAIFDTTGKAQRVSFDSPQSQSFGRGIIDISVDKDLNMHVVCEVSNDSIRTTADALKKEGSNFYIGTNQGEIGYLVIDTSLNIKYATYIGGRKSFDNTPFISVNSLNEATIVLSTANNSDFPTKNAYQNRLAGGADVALIQFGCNYEPKLTLPKNATVCKGDSIVLKVDSGLSKYEWSPIKSSSNILKATKTGKYYVIVTDSNGCSGGPKDSFELDQFTPLNPTIQALDATQFCSGDSARLRGRVLNFKGLRWNNGDTTLRTTAFKSGKYFLTATDSNGCIDTSNNINIQAIPKPKPVITSNTGSTNFCRKFKEITLDVGTGYSAYKWSTGATTNSIKVTKTGWYKVVVFNGFNCSDSDSVFVRNSFATPPVISSVNPVKFCNGDSVTFNAPIGYTNFLWSTGSGSQSIKVGRNRDVFLIASDTNGCRDTSIIIKTERINDSLKIKPSALGPFCFYETLSLQVDTGYSAYKWSTGDSTRAISTQRSGNYYVTALSSSGCKVQSDTISASFFNSAQATILYNKALRFCAGDSIRLYFSGAFNSFSWGNTTATTQSFYANKSGVYTLNIIDTNNCRAVSDSVKITVDPLPVVQVTSNKGLNFCDKDSALIGTNKSFSSHKWSNGQRSRSFYIKNSASLWVEVTDNNGCSNNSDTLKITKFDLPDTTAFTIGATTFCQGDSFIINLKDTTSTVNWSDRSTSYQKVINSSGNYKAILQNKFGCIDSTREFKITVNSNPNPKLAANGALNFCENLGPRQIATTNKYARYTWNTSQTTSQISANTSGNYYVSVIDSNGCVGNSDTIELKVFDLPQPEIIGLNGNSFCDGDSTFITTKKPYTKYLWSNSSTSSGFTVKQNLSVFVDVTDSNGCVNRSSPLRISVLPLPSPFSISSTGKTSVCHPNTVTLNAPSSQSKYLWSNGSSGNQIKLDSTQKISLTVENIFGCKRQSADSIQVYVGVPAALTFEGTDSFCLGDSFYIEAAPTYSSYLWSNGAKTNSISIKTTDTFYLRTVDSIGCAFNSDTFYTKARPLQVPKPWSIARGNTSFCNGDSLELLSPTGYVAYLWNNGKATSNIYVTQSGSYEVIVIDSLGCRGRSPAIDVTVFELPEPVIISIESSFCSGDTIELGLAKSFDSYIWSTPSFDSTIKVAKNAIIKVTVQDSNQCFGVSKDFVVEFNKKPSFEVDTLWISGNCDGDSMNLLVAMDDINSTLLWTDSTVTNNNIINSSEFYGFTVTNPAGCTRSFESTQFITFSNPIPQIIVSGNDSICVGDNVELRLSETYNEIFWNNLVVNQEAITVSDQGYNSVLVIDVNGCRGTDSFFITTIDLPNAKLNYTNSVSICPSDSVEFAIDALFNSYKWSTGNTEPNILVGDSGIFWVDVKNDFGCSNRSDSVQVNIKIIPDSIRLSHTDGVISANTDSIDVYNWYKNAGLNTYNLVEQGNKELRIKESNFYYLAAQSKSCELISDTIYVEFYDLAKTLDFAIYPNPTYGNIFLNIDAVNPNNVWCFVIDAKGKIIKSFDLGAGDKVAKEIDLSQLNKGIYQVKLVNGDQILTQSVVKVE